MLGPQLFLQLLPQLTHLAGHDSSGGIKMVGLQLHHSRLALWTNCDKSCGKSCNPKITPLKNLKM